MKSYWIPLLALAIALPVAGQVHADEQPPRARPDIRAAAQGQRYTPQQLQVIRQRANQLASEVEHLLEDIAIEGRATRQLYDQADAVMREVLHFQRSIRPGVSREHIVRDFRAMDQQVHSLLQSLQSSDEISLRRGIARVNYADQQLHFAVFQGDESRQVRAEVIARQAHALEAEAKQLARTARFVLHGRRAQELLTAIEQFAEEAEHFHEGFEGGAPPEHVDRDFAALDESWHKVVRQLNASPASAFLFRRAQRVNAIHNQLHRLLDAESEPTTVRFRFRDQ